METLKSLILQCIGKENEDNFQLCIQVIIYTYSILFWTAFIACTLFCTVLTQLSNVITVLIYTILRNYGTIQAARNFNSVSDKCSENSEEIKSVATAVTRLGRELQNLFKGVAEEAASQENEGGNTNKGGYHRMKKKKS